ncbi:MAG: thioredoxin fold domain-containing protein [Ignavibacteriales bacterium]|nr:thioredoxin fold domain-containing protein [Ignavibacteriales bacterium]
MRRSHISIASVAFIVLLLGVLRSSAGFAFQIGGGPSSSAGKVRAESKLSVDKAAAGSTLKAAVILKIADGWHINSNTPTYDYLIATSIEPPQREGFIVTDLRYPKGEKLKFGFAEDSLSVYEGTPVIFLTIKLSSKVSAGYDTLRAKLQVQACNDQVCLAPATIDVNMPIEIVGEHEKTNPINDDVFSAYSSQGALPAATSRSDIGQLFEERGTFVAFLAIFLIGLALNLTPCVYPMLSVTVSLFGGQSETNAIKVFLKAVMYVLGIATMYTVLGVSAALSGTLFGSWLQSPWVLGGIGALLIGLALSSFGLYQIQMPYWLTSKLGGTTGTGIISLYLSGLVVGVFAAPCIGPPVIALLTLVSSKADPVFGFWVFFTLSIGLGFPYLILGTFSGMLKKIPRSGAWLVWVERMFGVILSAAGLFYLALAFVPKLSVFVIPTALILGGIYLGFLEPSGKEKKGLQRFKWAFGVLALVFGLVSANALRETGMTWESFSEARVTEAKNQNRPVVMDFYADWCIPCLELEHKTFTDAEVISGTKDFVRLKVDLTHFDSPESEALRKKFNISGVPTIVFIDRTGQEVASSRVVGYLPPKEFLEKVKPVLATGS